MVVVSVVELLVPLVDSSGVVPVAEVALLANHLGSTKRSLD